MKQKQDVIKREGNIFIVDNERARASRTKIVLRNEYYMYTE